MKQIVENDFIKFWNEAKEKYRGVNWRSFYPTREMKFLDVEGDKFEMSYGYHIPPYKENLSCYLKETGRTYKKLWLYVEDGNFVYRYVMNITMKMLYNEYIGEDVLSI